MFNSTDAAQAILFKINFYFYFIDQQKVEKLKEKGLNWIIKTVIYNHEHSRQNI